MATPVQPFSRAQSRAKIRVGQVIFVKSIASGQYWLRTIGIQETTDLLDIDRVVPEAVGDSGDSVSQQMLSRSIREWKAAADSTGDYERVTHLWRSIECYANHREVGPAFTGAEMKAIRSTLLSAGTWSKTQNDRLLAVVGNVNDQPLLARFRAALESDGVEVNANAWEIIQKTRKLRNDLEHGRLLTEPEHRLLESAIAIMNYVIVSGFAGIS